MWQTSVKLEKKNDNESKTYSYDEAVELTGHGSYNYLLLLACCIITNASALDMFGFSVVVAAAKCDLQLGLTETGILASAPFVGVLVAHPWGYFADVGGRRRAMLWSTVVGFVFSGLSAFSPTWPVMMIFKVISCSFSNPSFSFTMTLLGECTGTRKRSKFLFILMSANFSAEAMAFALAYFLLPMKFSYGIPFLGISFNSWRVFALLLALPLGIGALMLYFLHESPKFLASRGENEKALVVLKDIFRWNGGKDGEYEVQNVLADEINNKRSFWQSVVEQTGPIFKPPLLWRTIQIFFLMSVIIATNNAFVMWYPIFVNLFFNSVSTTGLNNGEKFCKRIFSGNTTLGHVSVSNGGLCDASLSPLTSLSGITFSLLFSILTLVVAKVNAQKRNVLIFWLLVSAISGTLVDLAQLGASLVFFILFMTGTIGVPSLTGYCNDIYPTANRGMVTSLSMMMARLSSLVAVNLIGILMTVNCSLTYYLWSALCFSGVIVAYFLPKDTVKT